MPLNQFPRRSFVGSSTLQTFTGTGTQTAFTLSSAQTQNEVFLFVDDVAQVPGVDFTVSGTTLTFTTAPANAAEIIARGFGVPAPVTTVSDGTITSAKLATGAIEAKLGYTPVSPTQLSTEVNNIIASAPGALNTLDELAAALGDDANYAATITTALSAKANTSSLGTLATVSPTGTADNTKFLRGDNSWQVVSVTPTAVSSQANSATDYFALPSGTTAQRPTNPTGNMIRKNTTTGYIEYYDTVSSSWVGLGSFAASGGTVSVSGSYTYHTFTSSGAFVVSQGTKAVEYLVVAGGGSGGGMTTGGSYHGAGGGGGAGGYVAGTFTPTSGTYSVVIGAGGAGANSSVGNSGTNTSISGFNATTAVGGGYGGRGNSGQSAASGGSGGGGTREANAGGAGTSGQGNSGGTNGGSGGNGSGGGGAGGVGGNGDNVTGPGGVGINWQSLGTFYAGGGGGGGGGNVIATPGAGGNGGGGTGGANSTNGNNGGNASTNTGGGGGGGSATQNNSSSTAGGNGGSGILVIRYLT
jgi:hypothetical protein